MLEPDHLAAFARRLVAEHMMGRRLDAERILPGLKVLPLEHAGELVLAGDHLEADAERVVDDRDRHLAVRVGAKLVLPDLFVETQLRRRQRAVADVLLAVVGAGMRGPHHIADRRQIARAFGEHRMADIDVVASTYAASGRSRD